MALDEIRSKLGKASGKAIEKAAEYGSKAAEAAKGGAKLVSEKAQDAQKEILLSYYSPVFPDEYRSPGYRVPDMVVIADGVQRKDVDVCEGAIGWTSSAKGMTVLHMYDEFVDESGLRFMPVASCDSAYFAHPFDRTLYVNLSCYFEEMQKDKMAELKQIAHKLGAKSCRLETFEEKKAVTVGRAKGGARMKAKIDDVNVNAAASASLEVNASSSQRREMLFEQTFEGSAEPVRPSLRWFEHDPEIRSLVEMRCSGDGNATSTYSIVLDCTNAASMSGVTAEKVEASLKKIGASSNFSVEGEVLGEMRHKMVFKLEF